jgi:hypothetical protein
VLIWKLEEELRARGIPVLRGQGGTIVRDVDRLGGSYLDIDVPQALISIESRPLCDRGNFIVKVFPRGDLALSLDEFDAFPRYYFGVQACADEVAAWMRARHLLETAP